MSKKRNFATAAAATAVLAAPLLAGTSGEHTPMPVAPRHVATSTARGIGHMTTCDVIQAPVTTVKWNSGYIAAGSNPWTAIEMSNPNITIGTVAGLDQQFLAKNPKASPTDIWPTQTVLLPSVTTEGPTIEKKPCYTTEASDMQAISSAVIDFAVEHGTKYTVTIAPDSGAQTTGTFENYSYQAQVGGTLETVHATFEVNPITHTTFPYDEYIEIVNYGGTDHAQITGDVTVQVDHGDDQAFVQVDNQHGLYPGVSLNMLDTANNYVQDFVNEFPVAPQV